MDWRMNRWLHSRWNVLRWPQKERRKPLVAKLRNGEGRSNETKNVSPRVEEDDGIPTTTTRTTTRTTTNNMV